MAASDITIDKALQEDANCRLEDAKAQKNFIREDIEECYWFAAPDRHRSARTTPGEKPTRTEDAADRYISLPEEVTQDFTTEIWGAFFSGGEWAKQRASTNVPKDFKNQVEEEIVAETEMVHREIKSSNFEAAFTQAMVPDGAIGTIGLLIDDVRPDEPPVVQAIPIREIEINVGPFGTIDDRFIVRQVPNRHVKAVLPSGIKLPEAIENKLKTKPKERTEVRWGWWRDWSDRGNVVWVYTIMIAKTVVLAKKLAGTGSCPLIVARFNPDPAFAFGRGSLRQVLPEFRALDELTGLSLEHAEQAVHPSFVYPNDGTLNFEGGIIPGMGYPGERGVANDIKSLFFEGDLDVGLIEEEKLVQRIRRAFFVDRPEQTGDTPPSATQWIDQMALAQRRLAVPAASFWAEGPKEIFQRFRFILRERGKLKPIMAGDKAVTVDPYNPTERAKDMQEVQIAERLLTIIAAAFPQIGQAAVDPIDTINNIKAKLGDRIVTIRTQDQLTKAAEMIAPIMGGAGQGVPPQ